ncbi:MAG: aminotransferase class IV, partial [Mesonia sp.]
EAGTMNVFFRIGDKLITAPTSDRILDGITRKSIIDLAKHEGIDVEVRKIKVSEIVEAAKNGTLKEIFGTGTAATIAQISGFEQDGTFYDLPEVENAYNVKLKKMLQDIQANKAEDPFNWRYAVKTN